MANYKTGAQRYNDRMHKIFEEAKVLKKKYGTEDKGSWGNSGVKGKGVNSPAMMEAKKAIAKKMKRRGLEKYLDNFIKHGEKRSDENIWKYARLNPDSDKRIF